MEVLDKLSKNNIKHMLSLLVTTADAAVYILSGTLPVEAMVHQRVLTFGNISQLSESSAEKQLAERQLTLNHWTVTAEPRHDKTNKVSVRPAKTQISLGIAQSDHSLRCPHEESLGP